MRNKLFKIDKFKFRYFTGRLILLSVFALVTIATSYKRADDSLFATKSYSVTSNCPTATFTNGIITVQGGNVQTPNGINFLHLGFPSPSIAIGTDVSGEFTIGIVRTCLYSQSVISNTTTSIYSCDDNGFPTCTINLIHLD